MADTLYDFLLDYGVATEEELSLVSSCWGHNTDTYERVLFSRTGYRSMEQAMEYWGNE